MGSEGKQECKDKERKIRNERLHTNDTPYSGYWHIIDVSLHLNLCLYR